MATIDEGAPVYTSRTLGNQINGSNMATAMRVWMWDQNYGGIADQDWAIYFDTPTGIHDQTAVRLSATPSASQLALNLHMLNPIGYKDRVLPWALQDLIMEQAHASHGKIRLVPTGDVGVNNWTRSTGAGTHYGHVDEFVDDATAATGDYLHTTTNATEEQLSFPALPANAIWAREVIIGFLGSKTKGPPGSDNGLAFEFKLAHASLGDQSRIVYADMYANGDTQFRAVKMENLAIPSTGSGGWPNVYLSFKSARGSAGASPNPHWYIRALEATVYYEQLDIILVNDSSFSAFTTYESGHAAPYTIDFDITEARDYYEAALDIIGHGPEYFMYIDYRGQLSLGKVQDYSSATAIDISDMITGISKGPYKYAERTARAIELRWGVTIPHTGSGNQQDDPVNPPNERGTRRLRRSSIAAAAVGWGDAKVIDRHFIRAATAAERSAAAQLEMWGESPDAVDVNCTWRALEVEPGDVVLINRPDLGFSNRKFTCVANPCDADNDRVVLTLYDVDFAL